MADAPRIPPVPVAARDTRTPARDGSADSQTASFADLLDQAQEAAPSKPTSGNTGEHADQDRHATSESTGDPAPDAKSDPVATPIAVVLESAPPLTPPPAIGLGAYATPQQPSAQLSPATAEATPADAAVHPDTAAGAAVPSLAGLLAPSASTNAAGSAVPSEATASTSGSIPPPVSDVPAALPSTTDPTPQPQSTVTVNAAEASPTVATPSDKASRQPDQRVDNPATPPQPADAVIKAQSGNTAARGREETSRPLGTATVPAASETTPSGTTTATSPVVVAPSVPSLANALSTPIPGDRTGRAPLPSQAAHLAPGIVRLAVRGGGEYRVDLDPPELGRVRISAEVSDGRIALAITADHPDTLALLRNDSPALRSALADAGFETSGGDIRFSLSDGGQSGSSGGFDHSHGSGRPALSIEETNAAPAEWIRVPVDGLVDVSV